jgi:hypothetical protein
MDWLYGAEVILEQFQNEEVFNNICHDTPMQIDKVNGTRQYTCVMCGRFIRTTESFDSEKVETQNLEFKEILYGSKSGDIYISKVKEDIGNEIKIISQEFKLSDLEIMNILEDFMKIRSVYIPRAKPRKGIIGAIIFYKTEGKVKISDISRLFAIDQCFITRGMGLYLKCMNPFQNKNTEEYVNSILINYPQELLEYKQIYMDLIDISNALYISREFTIRTKCAGITWLLCKHKGVALSLQLLEKKLGMVKPTIYKFYDKLVMYANAKRRLNGPDNGGFANRRTQLLRYFEMRGISVPEIHEKGRFAKYYKIYAF